MAQPLDFEHDLAPLVVLLLMSVCICAYCFFIGTVCVRLWFYKGALGPEPERFIVIPQHRKERRPAQKSLAGLRVTVFPYVEENTPQDPFADEAYPVQQQPAIPAIDITAAEDEKYGNDFDDFEDPSEVRRYLAEERRISRLPAFDQDDCGDGSQFPNIPYAIKPINKRHISTRSTASSKLRQTRTYLTLGLTKRDQKHWLVVDNMYIEQWEARASLLHTKRDQCIQVMREGESACEELLKKVSQTLSTKYPESFSITAKNRLDHIRCDLTDTEYTLTRPFDHPPLETCARIASEDFTIFTKDNFTLQWYLQASATLFPSGYRLAKHIGKSLHAIINDIDEPMLLWETLPEILELVTSTPSSLFTRTATYIQTSPPTHSLASTLHIPRPADFFAGDTRDLHPYALHVRREVQIFKVLEESGAVVMSTKIELKRLVELDEDEKRKLVREIDGWDEDEATFKGRDLWGRVVRGWCRGEAWMRDDRTVVDAGA